MQSATFKIQTRAREEIIIVTSRVQERLDSMSIEENGICLLFTPHTTCAITVNENADPDVPSDLIRAIRAMIPDVEFRHGEGNSDAHLMSSIIGPSTALPFRNRKLLLGRWQGIYFVELDGPRERTLELHVL